MVAIAFMPVTAEFQLLARILLAVIFLAGSFAKAIDFAEFQKILASYGIIPDSSIHLSSVLLILLEFLTGAGVLIRRVAPLAGLVAAGILSIFLLAMAVNLLRGRRDVKCGCFGKTSGLVSWNTLARNLAFIGLALLVTGRFVILPVALLFLYLLVVSGSQIGKGRKITATSPG